MSRRELVRYEILGRSYYKYQYSVLYLSEYIHGVANGSQGQFEPLSGYVAYRYLQERLKSWKSRNDFDKSVNCLIRTAIEEYKESNCAPKRLEINKYLEKTPDAKVWLEERSNGQ